MPPYTKRNMAVSIDQERLRLRNHRHSFLSKQRIPSKIASSNLPRTIHSNAITPQVAKPAIKAISGVQPANKAEYVSAIIKSPLFKIYHERYILCQNNISHTIFCQEQIYIIYDILATYTIWRKNLCTPMLKN